MGREPKVVKKVFESPYNGKIVHEVELFPWEKLDVVSLIQSSFTIQ
jgi:S-adenosylmethionine synthetase